MRAKRFFIHTVKESPTEAELISHRLMLRAGLVHKAASGVYSWLPAGWRVVRKISTIVRQEMDAAGCAEVFMPAANPAELWQESGRWGAYGPELLRFKDRHGRDFCIAPTHEEVVTDIVRSHAAGHRSLPFNLYQIQTKFRDEIRPRFGVMRAREFIMKDAYSFDLNEEGMKESYEVMRRAYCRVFDRLGLEYRMVEADSGLIGGDFSHEFMVLADSGEEEILYCPHSEFASNVESAPCLPPTEKTPAATETMQKIHTPGIKTIEKLNEFLGGLPPNKNVKTMIVKGDAGVVAILLRGCHRLNMIKAAKLPEVGGNAVLATPEETQSLIGAGFGSLGPVNMPLPVIADFALQNVADFVCGANEDDYHFTGVNFSRDCPLPRFADLRKAETGDPSPDGKGVLSSCRGIEVGHIFQLGKKYSQAMNAVVDLPDGERGALLMGCYGIGITRIAAAAIEQGFDDNGIIFPDAIAPFEVAIAPISWGRSEAVQQAAKKLHDELSAAGVDVLLDDRDLRPGVMFADLDLIGIPHRLTIGERGLAEKITEYKNRANVQTENVPLDQAVSFLKNKIQKK